MANKYLIVNASNDVFFAAVAKGEGMVQPSTRRVLDLQDELSERKIEAYASSNIFIKKTNAAADNENPLPGMDSAIASARNQLMLVAGQERADLIDALMKGDDTAASKSSKSGASSATAAPSTTAGAQGGTAGGASTTSAGNTSTAGT